MNVLSIDIDYAYSPSISNYDEFIEGVRISDEEQSSILKNNAIFKPECNPEKLNILKSVVKNNIKKHAPVIIIENHDEILNFLPDNIKMSIYNFDHHHDIYYPGWHSLDKLDEGNWVYFLKDKNVTEYTWFRNSDSEDMLFDLPELKFNIKQVYNINNTLPMFDITFFCISSRWSGLTGKENVMELVKLAL